MKRAALLALALAGCAGGGLAPHPRPKADATSADAALTGPARWIFTDRASVSFDDAGQGSMLARDEPAITNGVRMIVEAGVVKKWARAPERLTGFRSIPKRLGGGYVLYSENRVYRADDFLGELKAIADVGVAGGVRPWMSTLLLRTANGMFEVDPGSLKITRLKVAGLADAIAIDAKRAARIDVFGRASVTADGGATWADVAARDGHLVTSLRDDRDDLFLNGPGGVFRLAAGGKLEKPAATPSRPSSNDPHPWPLLAGTFPASRSLAATMVADAMVAGARLPVARMIVARDRGLRVFSTATAQPIADADIVNVEDRFAHCQPLALAGHRGDGTEVLLACTHERGAQVLSVEESIASPKLEATFPEIGAGFVAGEKGRFGFAGRCGRQPPTGTDFGVAKAPPRPDYEEDQGMMPGVPPVPPDEHPAEAQPDAPPMDEARFCARVDAGHWVERKLEGDDAKHLYRWIPGDDGTVTALLLGKDESPAGDKKPKGEPVDKDEPLRPPPDTEGGKSGKDEKKPVKPDEPAKPIEKSEKKGPHEGIRVITIDPADAALEGGAFPAVPSPQSSAPFRSVDGDFWLDDDGAVRGWVHLPAAGETSTEAPAAIAQGPAARMLRVSTQRGGRQAGVRVAEDGKLTLYPLPDGVTEVAAGGRFGLAMAKKEGAPDEPPAFFETTDGGKTWTPIEGPPAGEIDPPGDEGTPFGCSSLGCALGSGVVRLGWSAPKPMAATKSDMPPAQNPLVKSLKPPSIACKLEGDGDPFEAPAPPPPKSGAPKPPPKIAKPPQPPLKSPPKAPPPKTPPKPTDKPKPPSKPTHDDGPPPLPVTLRTPSSVPLGALKDHAFTAEVLMPFDPSAAPKKLSVTDKLLGSPVGSVAPILTADKGNGVDLLMLMDKRRLRAGQSSSLFPFEVQAKISVFADAAGGALVALEDRGTVWIARGDATSGAATLTRVPEVTREKITLARALDRGGLAIAGYSTTSGEVFAGSLDLARAEVGPLGALGGLDTLTDASAPACKASRGAYRMILEVPISIKVQGKGGAILVDAGSTTAMLLVTATPDRVCLEGVEMALPKGNTSLAARFDKAGAAAVRSPAGKAVKAVCSIK